MKCSTYRKIQLIFVTVIVLFGTAVLVPPHLPAQSSIREPTTDEVFFPFISSLRVAVKDSMIRISWRDVPNYRNDYLVYRHTGVIDERTLEDAVLAATVPPGTEQYTDTPPESGEYYYAVLTQERNGSPLAVFIPFRNQTVRPTAIEADEHPEQLQIANIQTNIDADEVILGFEANLDDRDLAIMRSPSAIMNPEDIRQATLLEVISGDKRRYRDRPPAGVTYYYGIFDAATIGSDTAEVRPGDNATTDGLALELPEDSEPAEPAPPQIVIPETPERTAPGDTIPLPLLQSRFSVFLQSRFGGFPMSIPEPRLVSEKTSDAISSLLPKTDDPGTLPPPQQLSQDKAPKYSNSQLDIILQEHFLQGDWNQSYTRLSRLLSNSLSKELQKHVRFYRGQTLLFLDRPQEALNELLMVRDAFYLETKPYIDTALRVIAEDS